jgi:hypothetical protein
MQFSRETVEQALTAWRLVDAESASGDAAAMAEKLMTWWTTLQETATPWPVALAALERMLYPQPATDLDSAAAASDDTSPNNPSVPEIA